MTAASLRVRLHGRLRKAAPIGVPALAAFSAVAVGAGLGRALVTTYLPVLLERIRDAPGLIGMVMLVNTVAGFVVPLAIGAWSDRLREHGHGRTLPVVLGGSVIAAGGLLAIAIGHASSYLALALFAAIAYLGLNAVTTGHRALIPQTFDEDGRASATGGEELALLLGTLSGVVIGGALVEVRPWAPFALGALVLPALAVPTVRRMRGREKPPPPHEEARAGLGYYARAAARPGVRLVLAAQALWVFGYVGLPPFFVLYAERELDLRPRTSALVLAAFGIVSGAAMLLAGAAHPTRHKMLLVVAATAMGAGMLGVASGSSLVVVAPALVPVAIGFGVVTTLGFAVFSSYIVAGQEGAYSALYFSIRSISSAIALPLAGWTIAVTGSYRTLFVIGGVVTLAAVAPLLRLSGANPSRRARPYAKRAALFAGATAALLGLGRLIDGSELFKADAWLFEGINGFASTPRFIDALVVDPHLRNYALLALLAGITARRWGQRTPLRTMLTVVVAAALAYAAVRACWAVWERPRPEELLGTAPANGHAWSSYPSYPSGHVAVTTAIVVAASSLVPVLRIPLWSFAAVIAYTRLSYGAHFPSDVLSGLAVGVLAGLVAVRPTGQPLWRWPRVTRATARRAARASSVAALTVFGLLLAAAGPPAAPEGGLVTADVAHSAQVAFLIVATACTAAAWRREAFGAPLIIAGAALGAFAAVQFTPPFAGLAFLAFCVPGALFLLTWPRVRSPRHVAAVGAFIGVVSAAGAASAFAIHDSVYGPAHPESGYPAPPTWRVQWVWAGGVTASDVTVNARLLEDGRARLRIGTDRRLRAARASATRVASARNDRLLSFTLSGLQPDTRYYYGVEVDGRVDPYRIGTFRTFPAGRASFTFAVGACSRVGSNGAVFDAIRRRSPLLYLVTGDLFYANIETNSRLRFLDAYRRTLEPAAQAALYRTVPIAYVWDDHDYGGDASDATSDSRPAARGAYADVVPHYSLDRRASGAIYQAFSVGRVRFLMLDTRSERTPAEGPDGPEKTMLGPRQKAWLKRELLRARDGSALTVLVSSVPWIAQARAGNDSWGGYATERAEISRFLARNRIHNVLMVAGDAHMAAIDDGSHSDYSDTGRAGFPVLHAGALDRPGHAKGGPYSEGAFPGAGQYGTVGIDDHGDRVDVTLTGWRYTGKPLVSHRFSVSVHRP